MAKLYGDFDRPGPYLVLMKWNPGWSAHRTGTWWVNSGADFDPKRAVPVPAGGFVKRTARPVVVAVFGIGPVDIKLAVVPENSIRPGWRWVRSRVVAGDAGCRK